VSDERYSMGERCRGSVMVRSGSLLIAIALLGPLHGCVLVPVIDSVQQIGFTKDDRIQLLPAQVKRFQDAMYWGNYAVALGFVDPQQHEQFRKEFRRGAQREKLVETRIAEISPSEDGYQARVVVAVKRYDPSTLVVREIEEEQDWVFALSKGWRLASRRPVPESLPTY
jgi:hypothetical protein